MDVIADILNILLLQESVAACFKTATVLPVHTESTVLSLNNYRPVELTPILMKYFEKLVQHIKNKFLASIDPHQEFPFKTNRSKKDAISAALHLHFAHLDGNTYSVIGCCFS